MNGKKVFCLLSPSLSDYHIRKDVGLIPYIMQKHYGYSALITTYQAQKSPPDFPSLSLFDEKIDFDYITPSFTSNQQETASIFTSHMNDCIKDLSEYLLRNAAKIDVLFLYGFYRFYFHPVETYKEHNPKGIVYLKLDANKQWINDTEVDEAFTNFLKNCDIITSESMTEYLNLKWPVPVHYLPNGFYSFDRNENHLETCYPFNGKENIIFTSGRLGTVQKATEVLLEAFRMASSSIPEWKLVLAGDIEDSFRPYLEKFRSESPALNESIFFTGMIQDPVQLYEWYKKAKIFTLPSRYEGFPNVLSEAKVHGCYLVLSDIESNRDVIMLPEERCKMLHPNCIRRNDYEYGSIFSNENARELADRLIEACNNEKMLQQVCGATQRDAAENYDWIDLCGKIDLMIKNRE